MLSVSVPQYAVARALKKEQHSVQEIKLYSYRMVIRYEDLSLTQKTTAKYAHSFLRRGYGTPIYQFEYGNDCAARNRRIALLYVLDNLITSVCLSTNGT
jgi:hypothetical protein